MKRLAASALGLAFVLTGHTKYSNLAYGISLQYPWSYEITEGKLGRNDRGLGYLGSIPMEFVAPGGVRVVTVEAPGGSYPGTDFVNAFFTVSVNRYLTSEECERFPSDLSNMWKPAGVRKISGMEFHGLRQGEGGWDTNGVGPIIMDSLTAYATNWRTDWPRLDTGR